MKPFTKYMIKLAGKLEEKWLFRGEWTEELLEYFQAIQENLILLRRAVQANKEYFDKFDQQTTALFKNSFNRLMANISKLDKWLKPGRFLKFDFNRETSVIGNAHWAITNIIVTLDMVAKTIGIRMGDADKYAAEIKHDLDMAHDLFARQSDVLDKSFMTHPTRMVERDPRSPEEIGYEELHPDFQDYNIEDEQDQRDRTEELYRKLEDDPMAQVKFLGMKMSPFLDEDGKIDYYKLGFKDGEDMLKEHGFYSDILSAASSFRPPLQLNPNKPNYEKNLMDFARGVIAGSHMKHGNGYGSIEGEMSVLKRHLDWVKEQKALGKTIKPGYHHP